MYGARSKPVVGGTCKYPKYRAVPVGWSRPLFFTSPITPITVNHSFESAGFTRRPRALSLPQIARATVSLTISERGPCALSRASNTRPAIGATCSVAKKSGVTI